MRRNIKVFEDDSTCRSAVFDTPCPSSHISENNVIGNLFVERDDVFNGGGELDVSGAIVANEG